VRLRRTDRPVSGWSGRRVGGPRGGGEEGVWAARAGSWLAVGAVWGDAKPSKPDCEAHTLRGVLGGDIALHHDQTDSVATEGVISEGVKHRARTPRPPRM
jgi:hypothetical protein